eukprot:14911352-Alexandrium_andersonii.AAC.1
MAPRQCSCGCWYTHHACTRRCEQPEGPVLRARRARAYADDALEYARPPHVISDPMGALIQSWAAACNVVADAAR